MEFTEIIIQGIGEFDKPRRLPLKSGYTLILGGNESGKSLLYRALIGVIDPARFESIQGRISLLAKSEVPPRVGISFRGQEGEFRVVRDFRSGDVAVHQMDAQSQEWKIIDRSLDAWREIWAREAGISPDDYSTLCTVDRFELGGGGTVPRPPAAAPVRGGAGDKPENAEERIRTLQEELVRAEEIEKIEFSVDGLHSQVFQIDEQTKGLKELDRKGEELGHKLEEFSVFADAPADIQAKVDSYQQLKIRRDLEYTTLEEEKEKIEVEIQAASQIKEFYKDPLFGVGVVIGLASFVTTIVMSSFIPAPGLLAGVGLIFFTLWRFWAQQEKLGALKKTLEELEEKYRTLGKRFEIEGAVVENLMKKTGCSSQEELIERAGEYRKLLEKEKKLKEKKEEMVREINLPELEEKRKAIQAEIEEKQARLLEIGGLSMDPNEIRRELRRLEGGGGADAGEGFAPVEDLGGSDELAGAGSSLDPGHLIGRLSRTVKANQDELLPKVFADANKTLGEVTRGKYQIEPGPGAESGLIVVPGAESGSTGPVSLGASAREVVAAAIRLTAWKVVASRFQVPIVLDDPFRNFDPNRLAALLQILKRISTKLQVVHLSFNPVVAKIADHSVRLGA